MVECNLAKVEVASSNLVSRSLTPSHASLKSFPTAISSESGSGKSGSRHLHLRYDYGSLVIETDPERLLPEDEARLSEQLPSLVFDGRIRAYRAEAYHYGPFLRRLVRDKTLFVDTAKAFSPHAFPCQTPFTPRPFQTEALRAWQGEQGRGVVVLPTGAGKSRLAMMAIEAIGRPTLVLVPTLDLMSQWATVLQETFGVSVGLLGGGERRHEALTVSTYDSALLAIEHIGNRYGFLIADECHHLPSPSYQAIAKLAIAPYRLGLTATPERADRGERLLYTLMGPLCYRAHITELEGAYLSPYRTVQLRVPLDAESLEAYTFHRAIYLDFIKKQGVAFKGPQAWSQFVMQASRSKEGKAALASYRMQRRLVRASPSKFAVVWDLLNRHRDERVLIFTDDNATAYELGQQFFLPVITHHTRLAERKATLDAFRAGDLPYLVTSRVLNEGVDVPEASVGIVVSGSGSVREHVQRLGRILRKQADKEAVLYELISADTAEEQTGERRRRHVAYTRTHSV